MTGGTEEFRSAYFPLRSRVSTNSPPSSAHPIPSFLLYFFGSLRVAGGMRGNTLRVLYINNPRAEQSREKDLGILFYFAWSVMSNKFKGEAHRVHLLSLSS